MTLQASRAAASYSDMTDADVIAAARRLRHVSRGLMEAHELGYVPAEPVSLRDAAKEFGRVYSQTQAPELALAGAKWAFDISWYMSVRGSPPDVLNDWVFITDLLGRLAAVYLDSGSRFDPAFTPPVDAGAQIYTLDYRALGAVFPEDLATKLHDCTIAVEQALSSAERTNPLSPDEITLLNGLAAGRSISALAADLGYSERSISRLLRDIWDRVGASSRADGIAMVIAHGWLDAPGTTDRQ